MRRAWIFLPALACLVGFSLPAAGQWNIWQVHGAGVGEYTSLELDASGNPHISYYDHTDGWLLYTYHDGMAWVYDTVDQAGDVGKFSSLELDANDYPHIAYYAEFPDRDLRYAYWTGAAWNIDTVDVGTVRDTYIGLVLDANDYGHISYCVSDNLWYAYKDAGGWHTQVVDASAFTGYDSSIDLDPTNSDRPCISYIDAGNNWLRYAWYDGAIWQFDTADPNAAPSYTSLAIDPTGVAHIGYSRIEPTPPFDRELRYAYGTPLTFAWEVVPYAASASYGSNPSLRVNLSNNPRISFRDDANGDLLYAAKNGAWSVDTVDALGDVGQYCSLALENQSVPYISYYDVSMDWLKLAWESILDIGPDSIVMPVDTVAPGSSPVLVRIRNFGNAVSSPCSAYCAITPGTYMDTALVPVIPANDSFDVPFNAWTETTEGTYTICCWTVLPGDQSPANDTLCKDIEVWQISHDCGVNTILSPPDTVLPDSSYPVEAEVENFGNVQEIFTVHCWDIGVYSEVASCTLDPVTSTVLSFPTWVAPGTEMPWQMCCATLLPGDMNTANDTFCLDMEIWEFHDGLVVSILNPPQNVMVGTAYDVEATVRNDGNVFEDSIQVEVSIDGWGDVTWVYGLAPSDVATATFNQWTPPAAGSYQACFWTLVVGEDNPGNDTTCIDITATGVEEFVVGPAIPRFFALSQNSPNPVHHTTDIRFQMPVPGEVSLRVYDLTGSLVRTLMEGAQKPGYYSVIWDGRDENGLEVSSGLYFYRLTAGDFTSTRKLTILR